MDVDSEAGPSRPRRTPPPPTTPGQSDMDTDTDADGQSSTAASRRTTSRPASPETAFASRQSDSEMQDELARPPGPHLDLAAYPTATLLRLIANLLQQIAAANDQLRPEAEEVEDESHSSRSGSRASSAAPHGTGGPLPSPTAALFSERDNPHNTPRGGGGIDPSSPLPLFTASRTSLVHPSSLLSFHARHVPSISIEAYLLRILKYCPTTNEVFLSLLVYFDRMSRLGTASGVGAGLVGKNGKGFAIDSFNVHRLVIAGVTVASKFFSDVFYTNSRYAKVGGLPPHELNQLELQFLLLNDFRLAIPTDEMQRYGDRLLSYWEGREAETGVDAETGKELSEGGKRRAKERKERESKATPGPGPTEEDAARATSKQEGGGMEVDQAGQGETESHPKDPAQPPPEPAETASAPLEAVDAGQVQSSGSRETENATATALPPIPPQHAATAPPSSKASTTTVPYTLSTSATSSVIAPSPAPASSSNTPITAAPNGSRQKERSSSAASSVARSVSFSRGDVGGIGRAWGNGDQGVLAVSGTG